MLLVLLLRVASCIPLALVILGSLVAGPGTAVVHPLRPRDERCVTVHRKLVLECFAKLEIPQPRPRSFTFSDLLPPNPGTFNISHCFREAYREASGLPPEAWCEERNEGRRGS